MAKFRTTRVRVHGLKELNQALRRLPDAVRGEVLEDVLTKAAAPFAEQARALAPVRTGALKQSIAVAVEERSSRRAKVAIGPGEQPHGHWQEFGTAHHSPQPFMRPAWDSNKRGAIDAIAKDLRVKIEKAAARLARRAPASKR